MLAENQYFQTVMRIGFRVPTSTTHHSPFTTHHSPLPPLMQVRSSLVSKLFQKMMHLSQTGWRSFEVGAQTLPSRTRTLT